MAISVGEGYSLLGQGFAKAAQSNLSEQRKMMKEAQRRQLMTAALTPIAQGVGQFATDLISAPFRDPAKRFMTTDYGQKIKRAKKLRRSEQASLAAEAKRVSESGMGMMALYTREAGENIDRGYVQQLGKEEYENNKEFYGTSREERALANAQTRYDAYQKAYKSLSTTYTDEEWKDAITKYGSESPNAATSLWRGAKRILGVGRTNEELRKEAFNNIVDTMDLEGFVDPKNPKLIELRRQVQTGMRPLNPQQIAQQIAEDNKDNPIYQTGVGAVKEAVRDNSFYNEHFPTEYADARAENNGSIKKSHAAMRKLIVSNATLDDSRKPENQKLYSGKYRGNASLAGDSIAKLEEGFYSTLTSKTFERVNTDELAEYKEQVDKQVNSTLANVYVEATRAAEVQLYQLKKGNPDKFKMEFGDPSLAKINKEALILRNMDYLVENALEETPLTVDGKWNIDKEISVGTGRLIQAGIPDDFKLREDDAEQGSVVEEGSTFQQNSAGKKKTDPVASSVSKRSTSTMKGLYDSGSTAQAYKMGRDTIRQDIKNQNFKTAEEAVRYGLSMSSQLGSQAGMPDLSTVNGRASVKSELFAKDGDTQKFSVGGDTQSLLGRSVDSKDATYTLSMEDGQVNVSTSQPGQINKRKLSLEEIPNGNIKNHLTYLKLQYSQNMEALNTLGLDDPSSRSLSGLGGKARELKMINNEILSAIDLPGLGDREDVITFLTEQAPTAETTPTEVSTSLLSPEKETVEDTTELDFEQPEVSVVEAAAAEVSELFNDGSAATALLRETAIQESNMGQTKGTYTMSDSSGKFGRGSFGVSQVDERTFDDTLSRLRGDKGQPRNLVKYVDIIKDKAGIDLTKVTYEDLSDPKLSLIFSRLHYLKVADPVPPTAAGRAKYWKKHYNTSAGAGTPQEYLSNQKAYEAVYGV